jgi:hypothetical protein
VNQEVVGNESSVVGQRQDGQYRELLHAEARRLKLFYDTHKRVLLIAAIAAVGLLAGVFLIVSSKGQGMNPLLPVGLGFFVAYIAVRRKDE